MRPNLWMIANVGTPRLGLPIVFDRAVRFGYAALLLMNSVDLFHRIHNDEAPNVGEVYHVEKVGLTDDSAWYIDEFNCRQECWA